MANLLEVFTPVRHSSLPARLAGPDELARFATLRELDDESQLALLQAARLTVVTDQQELFHLQDRDDCEYFLLAGCVKLVAADGRIHRVEAGSVVAQQPLARLRPRQYTAVVEGEASLLVVDRPALQHCQHAAGTPRQLCYGVEELEVAELGAESEALLLFRAFRDDVRAFRVHLPELLPSVAEIRRLSRMGSSDCAAIAHVAENIPLLGRYLVRAANSPLFNAGQPCSDCASAVARLGVEPVSELALAFTPALFRVRYGKERESGWQQGLAIAAAGWWLAHRTGLVSPRQAMVLGLLHNAGMLVALSYLEGQRALDLSGDERRAVLPLLCRDITRLLFGLWDVDDVYVQALPALYDWRLAGDSMRPGLADVLQSAHYLQLLTDRDPALPAAQQVAGLGKLLRYEPSLTRPHAVQPDIERARALLRHILEP